MTLDVMHQAIIGNSDARFEPNGETMRYEARGNGVEVALLNFLIDNNTDAYNEIIKREE